MVVGVRTMTLCGWVWVGGQAAAKGGVSPRGGEAGSKPGSAGGSKPGSAGSSGGGKRKSVSKKERKKAERHRKRKEVHGFSVAERAAMHVAGRDGWDVIASSGREGGRASKQGSTGSG